MQKKRFLPAGGDINAEAPTAGTVRLLAADLARIFLHRAA
jgi:hypothetical protein